MSVFQKSYIGYREMPLLASEIEICPSKTKQHEEGKSSHRRQAARTVRDSQMCFSSKTFWTHAPTAFWEGAHIPVLKIIISGNGFGRLVLPTTHTFAADPFLSNRGCFSFLKTLEGSGDLQGDVDPDFENAGKDAHIGPGLEAGRVGVSEREPQSVTCCCEPCPISFLSFFCTQMEAWLDLTLQSKGIEDCGKPLQ